MRSAAYWIETLHLLPHPEGGYYREVYRSPELIPRAGLPHRYTGARNLSTSIYFLLDHQNPSRLHRLKTDEVWHFYYGSPITLHLLEPAGGYRPIRLGPDAEPGGQFQAVVSAGCWFGAAIEAQDAYALAGCTLGPGFDFADFELGRQDALLAAYPGHAALIQRLTKG